MISVIISNLAIISKAFSAAGSNTVFSMESVDKIAWKAKNTGH
jgi:hypothetical protein